MNICKLDIRTVTAEQFEQIVAIEENCGLEPYSREMLAECIEHLDTYACMDGNTVAGFITIQASPRRLGGGLYIVNLNIGKLYRRQGLGQMLITTGCGFYRESHRGSFVILDVALRNNFRFLCFAYAVPVSMIVWLVMNSIWFTQRRNYLIISLLMWTSIGCVILTLAMARVYIWQLAILGLLGQVIIVTWSKMQYKQKK